MVKLHLFIRSFLLGGLLIIGCLMPAFSQSECVFSLQRAERLYQQGNLEEIPGLLINCIEKGFTRDERLTAYKLLIQSYLYDDQLELADQTMLEFLNQYPEYELTPVDQAEFEQLFHSYETKASWSVSITGGVVFSFPYTFEPFGPYSTEVSSWDYSSGPGFRVGAGLMKYLAPGFNLNAEIQYFRHEYNFTLTQEYWSDFSETHYTETSSSIAIPVSVTYDFNTGRLKPYLRAGLMANYMFKSALDPLRIYKNGEFEDVTGSDLSMIEYRNPLSLYVITGTGLKYKIPYAGQLVLDIRFDIGLTRFASDEERFTPQELIFRYYDQDHDSRFNFLSVSLGWIYPLYKSTKQPSSY